MSIENVSRTAIFADMKDSIKNKDIIYKRI